MSPSQQNVAEDAKKTKRKAPQPPASLSAKAPVAPTKKPENPFLDHESDAGGNPFLDDDENKADGGNPFLDEDGDEEGQSGNPFLDDADDEAGSNPFLD